MKPVDSVVQKLFNRKCFTDNWFHGKNISMDISTSPHKPAWGEHSVAQTLFLNGVAVFIFSPIAMNVGFKM